MNFKVIGILVVVLVVISFVWNSGIMSGGGATSPATLMQLSAVGAQDTYLTAPSSLGFVIEEDDSGFW